MSELSYLPQSSQGWCEQSLPEVGQSTMKNVIKFREQSPTTVIKDTKI